MYISGEEYPPKTVKEVVVGIQKWFNHNCNWEISVLNDREIKATRCLLDGTMKSLAKKGHVKPIRRTEVITVEMESNLWERKILGDDSPRKLLDSLIFSIGIHCCLRACSEHRNLSCKNLYLESTNASGNMEEVLVHNEIFSKNRQHGVSSCRVEPKSIVIHKNKIDPQRCLIRLYKEYMKHR